MRHSVYGKHLGRNTNERIALFRNLVRALLLEEKIQTTQAKSKAIKGLVDRLITQAKSPNTHRFVRQFVTEKKVSDKLINELVPRLSDRTSGYTSVVRMGPRLGDGAMMVQMSLLLQEGKKVDKKKVEAKSDKVESENVISSSPSDLRVEDLNGQEKDIDSSEVPQNDNDVLRNDSKGKKPVTKKEKK